MFDLDREDLSGRSVLDCCAGGADFVASIGSRAVAVDPAYALDRHILAARVLASLSETDSVMGSHAARFDWSWYGIPARRAELRAAAAREFLTDLRKRPGRYIAGALPHLPLASASFDLVLCSHLLFTWSDQLDAQWHRQAIVELARVARKEVRVFPLVVQGTGEPVPFLDDLRAHLRAAGRRSVIRTVPYRFQRGADQMLVVEAAR